MSTTTTNLDIGNVVYEDGAAEFEDVVITFGGAATLAAGCILARDSVSLKFVPFVKGGATNQNGIPKAVLTYALTASGAGDLSGRALMKGSVIRSRLVINADGNASNVDGAVIDQLRDYAITVRTVDQLNA